MRYAAIIVATPSIFPLPCGSQGSPGALEVDGEAREELVVEDDGLLGDGPEAEVSGRVAQIWRQEVGWVWQLALHCLGNGIVKEVKHLVCFCWN